MKTDTVLAANGLPGRWQGRRRFVIVELGFGMGRHFIATWGAWQRDAERCEQLVYMAIDTHPPTAADLLQAHEGSALQGLAAQLSAAWPVATANLHLIDFERGRLRLMLAWGDAAALLRQLQADADAFYLDGGASLCDTAPWDRRVIKGVARLAAPGATLATPCGSAAVRDALSAAGFQVHAAPGSAGGTGMTCAHFAPAFVPRRSPGRGPALSKPSADERHALVIGAGLAGASAADALARLGWRCTVLDRGAEPASAASGNPGGLFHGTAHRGDGVHTRFNRAAALLAGHRYAQLVDDGSVTGQCGGLVRLHAAEVCPDLAADYVHAVSGEPLSVLAGLPLAGHAWLYPTGGWVVPGDVVRSLLSHPAIDCRCSQAVTQIERRGKHWHALAADGQSLAQAPVLVLAGGADGLWPGLAAPWPLTRVRGQVSWFTHPGVPRRPLSGAGYALSLPGGHLLCGATTADGDNDPEVRDSDHRHNLQRLKALTGLAPAAGATLHGRTAWRATTPDRLPIVGAVPVRTERLPAGTRLDQARLVPRQEGLFVLGGLASRGLTWAPLAGEVLAAWIDGAPLPLEADLLDAIDPARWIVRAARRSAASG